ncbi:cupin domain-containing protein [Flammeovirga kamogawensis]|uniref:Cupin domain-containing protein n=1 Tax=Flammeovirga kamogawensis TaxID=373891 RepID=A0ABX8H3J4_9BACT|nr:hypothetical protein [Flammeovirga kamogawensis]MBB6461927.1 ureidoglycolate hydrolase [Flammeovirga kamogawensis]QWG10464.1 hypothetical protein KM029_26170 [Flammeovirga kamogawensis]TRX63575.1 hypothetical protein EO216_24455 [Flammeovirga kamogawensis]
MKITETYQHKETGYNPFLIREGWQVAQLNYAEESRPENIKRLDIHYLTDEAFMLIDGSALLVAAEIVDNTITYDMTHMEPGIIYNIPKNVWHTIALKEEAKVLIIEKDKTHLGDFEFYDFNNEQYKQFLQEIHKIW